MLGLGNSIPGFDFIESASLLLDKSFAAGPAAAYSLRRVSSSYSGPAVQIRRASDNVEVNVNFDSDGVVSLNSTISNVTEETSGSFTNLTTSAKTLGEFVANASYTDADSLGSTDSALVQNWYDQSGNSNDAIQSTAGSQPKIVSNGSLVTENGKPALEFTSDFFLTNNELNQSSATNHFYIVNKTQAGTSGNNYFSESSAIDGNGSPAITQQNTGDNYYLRAASSNIFLGNLTTIKGNQAMFTAEVSNTTSKVYFQGSELASVSSTGVDAITDKLYIGLRWTGADSFKGTYQEFVLYNSDQSSNRTAIEAEINTFYSIF
tara:strand:+ start:212 stop:1171 length:960 start_codon:yes stop_codon:yes gene_type:complete